ncbi:hypothetical protein C8A01DRAFT_15417, partial [Parachaetomium inaequale]
MPVPPSPPPPGERRRYAPLTPSPLNPNTYLANINNKIRPQQEHPASTTTKANNKTQKPDPTTQNPSTLPQKYAALAHASPTQRLLRQKAAAAWR